MQINNQDAVLRFLGLCMRAGQIVSGQDACVTKIRNKEVAVVFLDEGASDNTIKRITDACKQHQICMRVLEPGVLGYAIGRPERMVIAVLPGQMANKVLNLLT